MSDEIAVEQPAPTLEPETVPPLPAKRRPAVLIAGLVGLLVGAGGVGAAWAWSAPDAPKPVPAPVAKAAFSLSGTLTLASGVPDLAGTSCKGTGGYSDIGSGTSVTVYDAAGTVIGSDTLSNGRTSGASLYGRCDFLFSVPNVPDGSNFYQVEISHRGKLTVAVADAKAGRFAASLG